MNVVLTAVSWAPRVQKNINGSAGPDSWLTIRQKGHKMLSGLFVCIVGCNRAVECNSIHAQSFWKKGKFLQHSIGNRTCDCEWFHAKWKERLIKSTCTWKTLGIWKLPPTSSYLGEYVSVNHQRVTKGGKVISSFLTNGLLNDFCHSRRHYSVILSAENHAQHILLSFATIWLLCIPLRAPKSLKVILEFKEKSHSKC